MIKKELIMPFIDNRHTAATYEEGEAFELTATTVSEAAPVLLTIDEGANLFIFVEKLPQNYVITLLRDFEIIQQHTPTTIEDAAEVLEVLQRSTRKSTEGRRRRGFTPYKGREVTPGQRVFVYRNLHNNKYSIADAASGLVLGHAHNLRIEDASFIVREAGRQRVLKERRKNVHAFVCGYFEDDCASHFDATLVTYNPYKSGTFTQKNEEGAAEPITAAASVSFTAAGVYCSGIDA